MIIWLLVFRLSIPKTRFLYLLKAIKVNNINIIGARSITSDIEE